MVKSFWDTWRTSDREFQHVSFGQLETNSKSQIQGVNAVWLGPSGSPVETWIGDLKTQIENYWQRYKDFLATNNITFEQKALMKGSSVETQQKGMQRIQIALAIMFQSHHLAISDSSGMYNGLSKEQVLEEVAYKSWKSIKQQPAFENEPLQIPYDLEAAAVHMKLILSGADFHSTFKIPSTQTVGQIVELAWPQSLLLDSAVPMEEIAPMAPSRMSTEPAETASVRQ